MCMFLLCFMLSCLYCKFLTDYHNLFSRIRQGCWLMHFCCTTFLMYHIPKRYIAFDASRCSTKSSSFPCYCPRSKYIAANTSYSKHRLRTYQPHCGPPNCRPICQSCVETDAKRGSASIIGRTETAEMLYAIYIMWHILNIKPHRNAISVVPFINK